MACTATYRRARSLRQRRVAAESLVLRVLQGSADAGAMDVSGDERRCSATSAVQQSEQKRIGRPSVREIQR